MEARTVSAKAGSAKGEEQRRQFIPCVLVTVSTVVFCVALEQRGKPTFCSLLAGEQGKKRGSWEVEVSAKKIRHE